MRAWAPHREEYPSRKINLAAIMQHSLMLYRYFMNLPKPKTISSSSYSFLTFHSTFPSISASSMICPCLTVGEIEAKSRNNILTAIYEAEGGNCRTKSVPKVCPKISKTIEKYLNPSKSGRPRKEAVYRGKPLFFALYLFALPSTHGRSHRFKSCIAHHL